MILSGISSVFFHIVSSLSLKPGSICRCPFCFFFFLNKTCGGSCGCWLLADISSLCWEPTVHHAVLPNALRRRSLHLEITILLFYSSSFSFPCISPRAFVPAVSSLKKTRYSVQIKCVYSKGLLRACTVGFLYPGFRGTCLCILQFSQVQIKKYSESQLHLSLTLRLSFWAWFPKQYR